MAKEKKLENPELNLTDLPTEIHYLIAEYLSISDLAKLKIALRNKFNNPINNTQAIEKLYFDLYSKVYNNTITLKDFHNIPSFTDSKYDFYNIAKKFLKLSNEQKLNLTENTLNILYVICFAYLEEIFEYEYYENNDLVKKQGVENLIEEISEDDKAYLRKEGLNSKCKEIKIIAGQLLLKEAVKNSDWKRVYELIYDEKVFFKLLSFSQLNISNLESNEYALKLKNLINQQINFASNNWYKIENILPNCFFKIQAFPNYISLPNVYCLQNIIVLPKNFNLEVFKKIIENANSSIKIDLVRILAALSTQNALEVIKILKNNGFEIKKFHGQNNLLNQLMECKVKNESNELVKIDEEVLIALINMGLKTNYVNLNKLSSIDIAIICGFSVKLIRKLIESGALNDTQGISLNSIYRINSIEILEYLFDELKINTDFEDENTGLKFFNELLVNLVVKDNVKTEVIGYVINKIDLFELNSKGYSWFKQLKLDLKNKENSEKYILKVKPFVYKKIINLFREDKNKSLILLNEVIESEKDLKNFLNFVELMTTDKFQNDLLASLANDIAEKKGIIEDSLKK